MLDGKFNVDCRAGMLINVVLYVCPVFDPTME